MPSSPREQCRIVIKYAFVQLSLPFSVPLSLRERRWPNLCARGFL
jgi:hypothetical protein